MSDTNETTSTEVDNSKTTSSEDNTRAKHLNKAIAFLLNKETEHIPIEDKKQFLLKHLPEDVVNSAIDILPTIKEHLHDSNSNNQRNVSMFSSLFDIGIVTTALLTSLLVNYVCDVSRDKKNDYFITELQRSLKEDNMKINNELKEDINLQLSTFVEKKTLSNDISSHLEMYSQGKGLTVNPSLSKIKSDINTIQNDIITLNTKIESNNFIITQNIKNEMQKVLNDFFNKQQPSTKEHNDNDIEQNIFN
jgi:hypothetical protein